MIKNFTPRLYQETILVGCTDKNSLIVLPTGLGKTNIFMMLAAHRFNKFPDSKIVLLGPTRPLISQYKKTFEKHFEINNDDLVIFTGHISPEKREILWKKSKIIFSTPQGFENDIISGRINLKDVSLIGFDEAHRAVGNYAYVFIAKQYMKKSRNGRIVAMTASPGSDLEKITDVCTNLHIENLEVRTEEDSDVKPYVNETKVKWIYVELPKLFDDIIRALKKCYDSKIDESIKYGFVSPEFKNSKSKRDILGLQGKLQYEISQGNKQLEVLKTISLVAEALKIQHALELIETQGVSVLNEYLENILVQAQTTKTKAVINLSRDINFRTALVKSRNLIEINVEHPKITELKKIVEDIISKKDEKIILFCQYRNSIEKINKELDKINGIKPKVFVGQAKKKGKGLSQKEQIKIIDEFRENKFNVLVASSVGEEGLDIPFVNHVIFYEPIPSAIRTIQRRGRTGRHDNGNVIVLVAKGTRDEAYRWSSHHKQNRMYSVLEKLKSKFNKNTIKKKDHSLLDYSDEDIKIYVDHREKGKEVVKKLIDLGAKIKLEQLEVGDYILSSRIGIEFKNVKDFVDSIIDKRLLLQVRDLKKYEKPLLLIEGEEDIYSQRNIHPNAINGILSSIVIDYGVPILRTKNSNETALLFMTIAKREQKKKEEDFTLHHHKPSTLKEQQEYIISSLPGVGGILSKPLLKKFGSVKNIVNSSVEELKKVELIGDIKAKNIKKVIDSEYNKK